MNEWAISCRHFRDGELGPWARARAGWRADGLIAIRAREPAGSAAGPARVDGEICILVSTGKGKLPRYGYVENIKSQHGHTVHRGGVNGGDIHTWRPWSHCSLSRRRGRRRKPTTQKRVVGSRLIPRRLRRTAVGVYLALSVRGRERLDRSPFQD
ncbi:hypothetical protein LZ30DRAFT_87183 [Colletotrichum cereale]|nr:hypothetical protein LZ30DRAFT_87183 [Colletotrichum cereale]